MTFSVVVPTAGRATLQRTLASVVPQLGPLDEVVVVGDGPQPEAAAICATQPGAVRYFETPPTHCYGNAQRQAALGQAYGDYLLFLDDDDVWFAGALSAVRRALAAHPGRPMLCRFVDRNGCVLWRDPVVRMGNVSTQQIVFPNRPDRWGAWAEVYEGDYYFIRSTLDRWPGGDQAVIWQPTIIADCRPEGLPC